MINDPRLGTIRWSNALLRHFRQLDAELGRSRRRIAWIMAIAATVATWGLLARPTTDVDGYGEGSSALFGFMLALGGLIASIGVWRLLVYAARRRANPEAHIVVLWSESAGPRVTTTIIDGGPKLGVDTPIDDMGLDHALNVGGFGGGHPLLALGVLAVSAAVNGASYLRNRNENRAKQAALTAEYIEYSRYRLSEMSRRYLTLLHELESARKRPTSANERNRLQTLLNITEFALQQVGAAPDKTKLVVLTKSLRSKGA